MKKRLKEFKMTFLCTHQKELGFKDRFLKEHKRHKGLILFCLFKVHLYRIFRDVEVSIEFLLQE